MSVHFASAQEMLGIANSNYAGNMGMEMNPSSMVGMPFKYEWNYISGDIFAQNDYIYVPARYIYGKGHPNGNKGALYDHYTYPSKKFNANLFLKCKWGLISKTALYL